MVARDDSVIRGSLIAVGVLLVLSIALNIFFWQWGDTQAGTATDAKDRLNTANRSLADLRDKAELMKSMLGVGNSTQAERDELLRSVEGDEEMTPIVERYKTDMALIGQEVDPQNQNYTALPKFFADSLRSKNDVVAQARKDVTKARADADSDVAAAKAALAVAETAATNAKNELADAQAQFKNERADMKQKTQEIQDRLTIAQTDAVKEKNKMNANISKLNSQLASANSIIESQRQEINLLKNDQFEVFQGEITSAQGRDGGDIVNLNLGSADALRPGVTFGVLSGDALRPDQAKVKATIQIVKVRGQYISEARVVARPGYSDPITPGDKVYSPFWSPGRRVKIALLGEIDIDGDGQPDNAEVKAQIRSVGAEVVDPRVVNGKVIGLDNSVRFLVEGTRAELSDTADAALNDKSEEQLQAEGNLIARANSLGVTVIPFWKLESYLKTIDDSLTTPLGSATRGTDFEPLPRMNRLPNRLKSDLPTIYTNQLEGVQRGNRVRK